MKAVVLVGGLGTRLRPLTLHTPKQMLPVAGVPMLERVLAGLARHGVDEAVLSLGYRPDAFLDAYPDAVCAGVRLVYAVEPEPLDTAGAVRFAAAADAIDDRFLVVNGDIISQTDLTALVAAHERTGAEGTIALTKVEDPSHFGVVPTDADGRVLAFVEKPAPGEEPTDLINAGFYVLEASVLDRIAADRPVNVEREVFPAMVADGTLFALSDPAYWIDVGTPERYIRANLDAAALDAPASVIGQDVVVGVGARIEGSVVLDAATVDAGAVVVDSVVGRGARIGEGAVVEAFSVVGDDAEVPAGATLTGARMPS